MLTTGEARIAYLGGMVGSALLVAGAFVAANASVYDLVHVGASRDRSRASRLVVPPLFEQLDETAPDVDVAVVNRS